MQHQALAVVETQPELPVLPAQLVAFESEPDPGGLADLQRRHLAQRRGDQPRQVLAHDVRGIAFVVTVLELEQRHRVQVDDGVQAGDVMGVRVGLLAAPVPDIAPAEPSAAVPLGYQRGAVGPHVGQHQGQVGDPAPGQRLDDRGVGAEHLVALVPLIDGHVRLLAGQVLPCCDVVAGQRDGGAVGLAVRAVPADDDRLPAHRLASPRVGLHQGQGGLGRLLQLDRGEPPGGPDSAVAFQDRRGLADLLRRQRVQRM